MRRNEPENLIDFPCSPLYIEWYAAQGMTPDYPPGYYQITREDDVEEMVNQRITRISARIEERLNLYQGQLVYLQNKITERSKYQKIEQKKPGLERIEI